MLLHKTQSSLPVNTTLTQKGCQYHSLRKTFCYFKNPKASHDARLIHVLLSQTNSVIRSVNVVNNAYSTWNHLYPQLTVLLWQINTIQFSSEIMYRPLWGVFLSFPLFTKQQTFTLSTLKVHVYYTDKSLTLSKTTNFSLFQTQGVCRWQFQIWWKWLSVFRMGRKHYGKRRNCSLRAISPFLAVFSRLLLQTCKNQGLFGNGLTYDQTIQF